MSQQGVQPDSLSYRILIYTASKTQAWPRALKLYRYPLLLFFKYASLSKVLPGVHCTWTCRPYTSSLCLCSLLYLASGVHFRRRHPSAATYKFRFYLFCSQATTLLSNGCARTPALSHYQTCKRSAAVMYACRAFQNTARLAKQPPIARVTAKANGFL